jgi:hypothetical protein
VGLAFSSLDAKWRVRAFEEKEIRLFLFFLNIIEN